MQFKSFGHHIFTGSVSCDENGCQSLLGKIAKTTGWGQSIVIAPSQNMHFGRNFLSFSFSITIDSYHIYHLKASFFINVSPVLLNCMD